MSETRMHCGCWVSNGITHLCAKHAEPRPPASPQSDQLGPNVYRGDDGVDRVLGISSGSLPQSDQPAQGGKRLSNDAFIDFRDDGYVSFSGRTIMGELTTLVLSPEEFSMLSIVLSAPASQPAPDDLPNRVRDDIAAWAEATHESGDQVTLEGFAEWLRHSWHWSGPALEKPTSQPSAAGADARELIEIRVAFERLQNNPDSGGCDCPCNDEDCCEKVDEWCPHCIATAGLKHVASLAALLESFRAATLEQAAQLVSDTPRTPALTGAMDSLTDKIRNLGSDPNWLARQIASAKKEEANWWHANCPNCMAGTYCNGKDRIASIESASAKLGAKRESEK